MKKIVKRIGIVLLMVCVFLASLLTNEASARAYGGENWGIDHKVGLGYKWSLCAYRNITCVQHGGSLQSTGRTYRVKGILTLGKYSDNNAYPDEAKFKNKDSIKLPTDKNTHIRAKINSGMAYLAYYAQNDDHPYNGINGNLKALHNKYNHWGAVQYMFWVTDSYFGYEKWWNDIGYPNFLKDYNSYNRGNFQPQKHVTIFKEEQDRLRTDMITYAGYVKKYNKMVEKNGAPITISTDDDFKLTTIAGKKCYGPFVAYFPQEIASAQSAYDKKEWNRIMGRMMVKVKGADGKYKDVNVIDGKGNEAEIYAQGSRKTEKNTDDKYYITPGEKFYVPVNQADINYINGHDGEVKIKVKMDTPLYGGRIMFMYQGSWQNLLISHGNYQDIEKTYTAKPGDPPPPPEEKPKEPEEPEIALSIRTKDLEYVKDNELLKYDALPDLKYQDFVVQITTPKVKELKDKKKFVSYKAEFTIPEKLKQKVSSNLTAKITSYSGDTSTTSNLITLKKDVNYTVVFGQTYTVDMDSLKFSIEGKGNNVDYYGTTIEIYVPCEATDVTQTPLESHAYLHTWQEK